MRAEKLEELKSIMKEFETVEVSDQKQITAGFLSLTQARYTLRNGKVIIRDQLHKMNNGNGNAANIFPITKEGNVILVVQPRVHLEGGVETEVPAGMIDPNEDPKVAAIRELREETGYTSDEVHFLKKTYQDEGCSSAQTFSFIALNCYKVGEPNLDFDENIKLFECTFDEVKELVDMGYIAGAGNIVNILYSEKFIKDNNIQLPRKDDNESYN